ncbi:MAG: tetratricopeptide repeat protein [Alphaproteobacteria bacterium]|nr:tetratricopeptide repeat protein [Alphaproteobacteria bacterium]
MVATTLRAAGTALVLLSAIAAGAAKANDRAACSNAQGDPEERIISCSRLLNSQGLDPAERAKAHNNRGVAFGQSGEFKTAIKDFDQAIGLKPDDPSLLNNRCFFLAAMGDTARAIPDCDRALRLKEPDPPTLDSRGYAHLRAGDIDRAIRDYTAALAIDPLYASSLWGRGVARQRKGDDARAAEDFAKAREANPEIEKQMAGFGLAPGGNPAKRNAAPAS